jgi:predicted CXXCH cytochrome family protein
MASSRQRKTGEGAKAEWLVLFLFVLIIAGIISCAPTRRKKVLSFFFDGVPAGTIDTVTAGLPAADIQAVTDSTLVAEGAPKDEIFYHYPYKEQYCSSCHNENSAGEMVDEEPALCYSCHEDFSQSLKYLHGPVSGGFCTECHSPHMAKNEKLLIRTGQQLCLYCHDSASLKENNNHDNLGEMLCTECHRPHGGEDRYMFNW